MAKDWIPAPKSARGRLRELHVHFGLFDFAFYCVCGPFSDLPPYLIHRRPGYYCGDEITESRGLHFPGGCRWKPIVWIPCTPRSAQHHGTLAHEVTHVVLEMFDWSGMRLNRDPQETFCHAVGYGVSSVLEGLRR